MPKFFKDIVYLIIILLLVISNLLFYTSNRKNASEIQGLNQRISELGKQNEELNKQNQEIESFAAKGWKEYTDDKYKFKIWYPEMYTYYNEASKVEVEKWGNYNNRYEIFLLLSDIHDEGNPVRIMNISVDNNNLDIKNYIKEDIEKKDVGNKISPLQDQYITKEKINGMDLYKAEVSDIILRYYVKKDNSVFIFNPVAGSIDYPQEEERKVFDQMVQSFRFTN